MNAVSEPHPAGHGDRKPHDVSGAPPIPLSLKHLPVLAGLAVPYITARRLDGAWRFGAIDADRQEQCLHHSLCQVCGRPLESGPMVFLVRPVADALILPDWVVAEVAEPALHPHCLAYTVAACPMLSGAMTHYRTSPVPMGEGAVHAPDSAARYGHPAEPWYEVWVRHYQLAVLTSAGHRSVRAKLNQRPLRIRALENHPAHPGLRRTVPDPTC